MQAFGALDDHVLDRIARYAAVRAAFLEYDAQDLFNDAVVCFVRGARQWSPETLERDFIGTIRSISWNLYKSQSRRKDRETSFSGPTTGSPPFDEQIEHVQRVRCMLQYFDEYGDADASMLIRAMLKHSTAKLAAESLGFSPKRMEAVLKRIRRTMRPKCSKKK